MPDFDISFLHLCDDFVHIFVSLFNIHSMFFLKHAWNFEPACFPDNQHLTPVRLYDVRTAQHILGLVVGLGLGYACMSVVTSCGRTFPHIVF